MSLGILTHWPNKPFPSPLWVSYGIPMQFASRIKAQRWIDKHMGEFKSLSEVRDIRVVLKYTKITVEVYSERLSSDGKCVINPDALRYEDIIKDLIKSYKIHKERHALKTRGNTLSLIKFKGRRK